MRFKRSRLSCLETQRLLEHFVAGTPARTATELLAVNCNTARVFYHRLGTIIAHQLEEISPVAGEIEVDESYFGGHRKGKRGRGAAGKVPVFGLLKRGGKGKWGKWADCIIHCHQYGKGRIGTLPQGMEYKNLEELEKILALHTTSSSNVSDSVYVV